MPYKFIAAEKPKIDPNFAEAIAQELRLQRPDGPPDAPIIIEEETPRGSHLYVRVIWDAWGDVPMEERGRIILDAYQKAQGADAVLKISNVLGLTHAEARRLGVEAA
ncbi:MAG: hypothetical protein JO250_12140 [Armatimonadetes bacterium]|nr:hypothetical protein [Armatimonadota bacterium]